MKDLTSFFLLFKKWVCAPMCMVYLYYIHVLAHLRRSAWLCLQQTPAAMPASGVGVGRFPGWHSKHLTHWAISLGLDLIFKQMQSVAFGKHTASWSPGCVCPWFLVFLCSGEERAGWPCDRIASNSVSPTHPPLHSSFFACFLISKRFPTATIVFFYFLGKSETYNPSVVRVAWLAARPLLFKKLGAKQNEEEVINKWLFLGECDKTPWQTPFKLVWWHSECNWDSLQKRECGVIFRAWIIYEQ